MNKEQIFAEINEMIDRVGLNNISSIAFGLMQKEAEIEGKGDDHAERDALQRILDRVKEAAEEEIMVLNGGEGHTYIAP